MAGMKRGPAPKRTEERIRNNKPPEGQEPEDVGPDQMAAMPFDIDYEPEPPEPDEDWHPTSRMLYDSLLRDPARIWMGPADWATAYLMCESISRELYPQVVGVVDGGIDLETGEKIAGHVARETVPMKGQTITAFLKFCAQLGITEGGRLSLRKQVTFHTPATTQQKTAAEKVHTGPRSEVGLFSIDGGKLAQ